MMKQNEVSTELTIHEAQRMVDDWIKRVGVRYFNELTNLAMLTEEVGEVARIMARRYGEQSEKPSDAEKVLADELARCIVRPYLPGKSDRSGFGVGAKEKSR